MSIRVIAAGSTGIPLALVLGGGMAHADSVGATLNDPNNGCALCGGVAANPAPSGVMASATNLSGPLLSGFFALIGVLIAQCIVLYLARRTDRRRSEPELLRQCAIFSSAAGRFKREVVTKPRVDWNLDCLSELEEAADSIVIIGTPEIEGAAERFIGFIPLILDPERSKEDKERARQGIFDSHRLFIDAVRKQFHKQPKEYRAGAVPIIVRPHV